MFIPHIPEGFVRITEKNRIEFSDGDFIPNGRWLSGSEWKQVQRQIRNCIKGCFWTTQMVIIAPAKS